MTDLFLELLGMSLSAGILVLVVVGLRFLLKKAPKWIACCLWILVAVRLVCPISMESVFSLIPQPVSSGDALEVLSNVYTENIQVIGDNSPNYQAAVDAGRIPEYNGQYEGRDYYVVTTAMDGVSEPATLADMFSVLWLAGMFLMAGYALVSYLRLKWKVAPSLLLRDNIFLCDYIESPFILGIVKPKIYLPSSMDQAQWHHVLAHEQAHLKRRDHWWKPLGFALLCLHWFNPVLWLAYILLCRDIELACDEKVIKTLGAPEKKAYSEALLACSVPRHLIAACPLAFGEVGVKERVKTVLDYKKPTFWVIVIAVIAVIITAVCFLTDPVTKPSHIQISGIPLEELPAGYSLADAINDGCVVMMDGDVVVGQEQWRSFVDETKLGKSASIRIALYYTIGNPDRMSDELFASSRERYPVIYVHDISYDGNTFSNRWIENGTEYYNTWKYLMHYTGTPNSPYAVFDAYEYYCLTDRDDVTWEQLQNGMYSADFRDQIPYSTVYSDHIYPNEPTLADLHAAREALIPYMEPYRITGITVNEITGRMDIQVNGWADGLYTLLEQYFNTEFANITEASVSGDWGQSVTADVLNNRSIALTFSPTGDRVLTYGTRYTLEEYMDGVWQEVPEIPSDIDRTWLDVAYYLNQDEPTSITIDWEHLYGDLSPGLYRITKTIYGDGTSRDYSVDFAIVDDAAVPN